jgi:hypothetical protein
MYPGTLVIGSIVFIAALICAVYAVRSTQVVERIPVLKNTWEIISIIVGISLVGGIILEFSGFLGALFG